MKKILGILFIGLLLCTEAYSKSGKGELKLDQYTMEEFIKYLYGGKNLDPKTGGSTDLKNQKANPLLFIVDENGWSYQYWYCDFSECSSNSEEHRGKLKCEKNSSGAPCWTFARKTKIVWKNSKNPKGKLRIKSKDLKNGALHVAKIIQEAGYYDGDITLLEGVGIDNSQSENTNIKNESKGNTVDQLETLTKLYEAGSLTKDEFEKAKKKILND
tara:strand:+ start:68 stop:712 length:645 start_codon:yes stop_codon:yes gene_type:complete